MIIQTRSRNLVCILTLIILTHMSGIKAEEPQNFLLSSIRTEQLPDFSLVGQPRTIWQNPTPNIDVMQYGPTPVDAIAYALADISKLPATDQPFQRYIWIPDGDKKKQALISYAINLACSKASTIIRPAVVADGRLVRCDLRTLAPRIGQYDVLYALWEELAFEPYFHITKTTSDALQKNSIHVKTRNDDPPGPTENSLLPW